MKDVLDDIERWRAAGHRVAVARVVDVEGSGPREPGATMAVNDAGEVAGSVSGGCVEGAVLTEALAVLQGERAPGVISFGYSDDEAFAVGLTCGGTIHLFVDPLDLIGAVASSGSAATVGKAAVSAGDRMSSGIYDALRDALRAEEPVALATIIEGPNLGAKLLVTPEGDRLGGLGDPGLDRVVVRDARGELEAGLTSTRHYGPHGEARERAVAVFIESFAPPPRMIIFGAVDFTAALARAAKLLGYRVTVCDARAVFATAQRFPMADEVVNDWPHRYLAKVGEDLGPRDAVCVLTHDHKFDVPAITAALETAVGYIGAMGSRRTHRDRVRRLAEAGVDEAALTRVMAPIGLDLGARTPEETAVSICAEIIALRTGRTVSSLRDADGPIHD
ncbi:MAG TPA: XdhC family protein [Acidimicrobiia bacterium]|nr:XdhC family protein [Acidimicrobiia bacterium]